MPRLGTMESPVAARFTPRLAPPMRIANAIAVLTLAAGAATAAAAESPDLARDIAPILTKYCTGCHNDADREGKLSLQSLESLLKGGARGVS